MKSLWLLELVTTEIDGTLFNSIRYTGVLSLYLLECISMATNAELRLVML